MPKNGGRFGPERPPLKNGGRPRQSEEEKRLARIRRAVDYDFKAHCRQLLPVAVDQLEKLLASGKIKTKGELLRTVEILRDSVHGKPAQTVTGPDGGPLVGSFTVLLGKIDGGRTEKI